MKRFGIGSFVLIAVAVGLLATAARAEDFWGPWPAGSEPAVVGKRISENLLTRAIGHGNMPKPDTRPSSHMGYPEACTAYGAMRLAGAIKDKELLDKLVARYRILLTPEGKGILPGPSGVDASVTGIIPLEAYIQTGDKDFLAPGLYRADAQFAPPPEGKKYPAGVEPPLSWHTRFWIDDMWMITGLQLEAYRATKDVKYRDRAAKEMVAYLDKLQQANGLFLHSTPETAPFYWGRGNGWFAVGMAEMLGELPAEHPDRARIMEGYKKMMAGLLKYQAKDGMWLQVIDHPELWPESSCTAMFTFGMARGVKNGWLDDPAYKEAAKKAWIALTSKYINADANVTEVCEGTNRSTDIKYYVDRKRNIGDLHGQAATVWAAWALLN